MMEIMIVLYIVYDDASAAIIVRRRCRFLDDENSEKRLLDKYGHEIDW